MNNARGYWYIFLWGLLFSSSLRSHIYQQCDSGHPGHFTISLYKYHAASDSEMQIGYIQNSCNNGEYGEITLFKIAREHRKKGYGRLLLTLALREFDRRGYTHVEVRPVALDDIPLDTIRGIYTKLGFKEIEDGKMHMKIRYGCRLYEICFTR